MFGERLKKLRIEKGLTQEELGNTLNKTKNNISQYETSKREPDSDTLKILADLFNVSIDYLLGRTEEKTLSEIDIVAEAIKDNPELQDLVKTLEQRQDLMLMFKKSKKLTPDAVKQILGIIKLIEDKESAEP